MDNTKKIGTLAIVCFLAVILMGQTISYYYNPYHFDMSAEKTDGMIRYSIDSNLSLEYTAVSLDNGNIYQIDEYVAFFDDSYPMPQGTERISESLGWLRHYLSKYDVNLRLADGERILNIVENLDVRTALIFATGAFPAEIYSGTEDDLLFRWLEHGGVLYWMNGKMGNLCSVRGDSEAISVGSSDPLFFNSGHITRMENNRVYNRSLAEGSPTDILGIYFNECTNGLNANALSTKSLSMDYSFRGYSSVVITKYYGGDGMMCVFGGNLDKDMASSVAQTISSRITYETTVIDYCFGKINKDSAGTLDSNLYGDTDLFIYLGRMQAISGRCIRL